MKIYNTIFTDEEYMEQGFTKEECPLIREYDQLLNSHLDDKLSETQCERMYQLAIRLGL